MKVQKKKLSNNKLMKFFNQMIGNEDCDPILIENKYSNYIYNLEKIISAWEIFISSEFSRSIYNETIGLQQIQSFIEEGRKILNLKLKEEEIKSTSNSEKESLFESLFELGTKYNTKELNNTYKIIKNSVVIKQIITTYKNILVLLEDDKQRSGRKISCLDLPSNLSKEFIINTSLSTEILDFSILDFKYLYDKYEDDVSLNKLVLYTLCVTYRFGADIYKTFMSPDIDIKQFVEEFGKKLDDMKKVMPNCHKAFKALKKSLHLLENNFESYYKEFMKTQNPGIIFESFFSDVQKKNQNNIALMQEFKLIIEYVKKNMPKNGKNMEGIDDLWKMSDKIFNT